MKETYKKIKENMKKNKSKIEIALLIIIIILLAIIVGLKRIEFSNFNPINGDFQNYNPVRRLLAGQIPYKDFAVYLGTGHLFLLSAIQLVVGNNFTLSLFVTNMITMLLFELTVFAISFFILKNKKQSLYLTLIMAVINVARPTFLELIINENVISALNLGSAPGNSARLIRNAIAPIIVLVIYIGIRYIDKSKIKFLEQHKVLVKKIFIAILAGGTILWSNDGGIATYITISFVYFLLLIKEYKKDIKSIIKYTFIYIGISLMSFFIILAIVTRGNILAWFEFTIGTSSYQKWYFGEAPSKENISLTYLDKGLLNIIMLAIAILYIYRMFKTKKEDEVERYALLNIPVIASIISTYMYQMLSGGIANEMLNLIFVTTVVAYIAKKSITAFKNKKKVLEFIATIIIGLSCITVCVETYNAVCNLKNTNRGVYIENLGGYFSKLRDSIQYAIDRIGNEKIFSTYASAIDVATEQFQPTGVDYIIHCLGDEQREKYLEIFKKGDFKYVTTTDRDYNAYRYWIRNANWFFYRELYKNYIPVFSTEYNVFWERNKIEENKTEFLEKNAKIKLKPIGKFGYTIEIEMNDKCFDGVADIRLAYNSKINSEFFKNLKINRYIYVRDVTLKKETDLKLLNYNLPNKSDEYYIPITIIDGKGEIEIYSYPIRETEITIESAEIVDVYDVNFKYCVSSMKHEIENNTLYVDNTKENKIILKDCKAIRIEDVEEKIINYEENDDYIKIKVEKNAEKFKYPSFFEIIREE